MEPMPRKASAIIIRELKSKDEFESLWPLVKQVNPKVTKKLFIQHINEMLEHRYRCIAAYRDGKMVGACGIWSGARFWCGKYMEVDNIVVNANERSSGMGKLMMDWVEKEARRLKCSIVMADSYTYNHASHRFYFREGYVIKGFCFAKELY